MDDVSGLANKLVQNITDNNADPKGYDKRTENDSKAKPSEKVPKAKKSPPKLKKDGSLA